MRIGKLTRWLTGLGFMAVGTYHFVNPQFFLIMMPEWIPGHLFWVLFTGGAEFAGGLGLLLPFARIRYSASVGLVVLLLGVWIANWYMAIYCIDPTGGQFSCWAMWARVPLQLPLLWIVWKLRKN